MVATAIENSLDYNYAYKTKQLKHEHQKRSSSCNLINNKKKRKKTKVRKRQTTNKLHESDEEASRCHDVHEGERNRVGKK